MKTWKEIKKEDRIGKMIKKNKEREDLKNKLTITLNDYLVNIKEIRKKIRFLNNNIGLYKKEIEANGKDN